MRDVSEAIASPPISLVVHGFGHLIQAMDNAAAAVESIEDRAQLIRLWHAANQTGGKAWQLRAHISHQLLADIERQSPGRGRKDEAGAGVTAQAALLAAHLGVAPSTLWEDRKLHAAFAVNNSTGYNNLLPEKSYYRIALATDNPHAALELFAQRKAENPAYEPADAKRDVTRERDRGRMSQRIERLEDIASNAVNDLTGLGKFSVILADPPWQYEAATTSPNREIEQHYPTMALDDICALPVPSCCHNDALLFLWATNPKLEEALRVLNAWGFRYRTNMAWVKPQIGMGHWVRQQHELLLIGRRGSMPAPKTENRPRSVIHAPRGKHSAKPKKVYDLIESMYPGMGYLELFARERREGWTSWGQEVSCHLQLAFR